jgi:hypothetical protein
MPVKNQIPKISLSSSRQEELIQKLNRMIEEATEFKGEWDSEHSTFMSMYLAKPDQEVKNWPWRGASNLFLPLTRVTIDSLLAQFYDAMLAQRPTVIGTEGTDLESARMLEMFYFDHVWTKILNLKEIGNDWLFDTLLDGTSAVKIRWNRDETLVRDQTIEPEIRVDRERTRFSTGQEVDFETIVGIDERIVEETTSRRVDRPAVDITDMSRIFVAPSSGLGMQWPECPWYYEVSYLTWDELRSRKQHGYDNIDEELRSKLAEHELTGKERTIRDEEEVGQSDPTQTAQVVVFYMRMALPGKVTRLDGKTKKQNIEFDDEGNQIGDALEEEVEIVYLVDTKKIARIIPLTRLYPDGKRPHIDNRFTRLPRHFFGQGIPAKMKHLNRLLNSTFNQMMDYGTLQNMPFFFYEPASTGLLADMNQLKPGEGIPVLNSGGVNFPKFQGNKDFQLSILQQVQAWAERDTAVTDFTQGRAASVPNAPRTAAGTGMLLQQSNIAFSRMVALMAEQFTELLRRVHVLYQRYAPQELEFKFFNQQTGLFKKTNITRGLFYEDVDFQFQLNPNRLQEQQNNMQMAQFMMSIPYIGQAPRSVRALAKQLYESLGKKNFDAIWPEEMMQAQTAPQGGPEQQQLPPGAEEGVPTEAPPEPSVEEQKVNIGG